MSRLIYPDQKQKLSLLLEIESLNNYLSSHEKEIGKLIGYRNCEQFDFIRSNDSVNSNMLDSVEKFIIHSAKHKEIDHIKIGHKSRDPSEYLYIHFEPDMIVIEDFADRIYDKDNLSSNELNSVMLVFMHSMFISYRIYHENLYSLVTENKKLLENREWLEKKFRKKLNIMTTQETMRYMDLYAKHEAKYYVGPHHLANKDLWYWYSFRTKMPHYHVPNRENSESVHILEGVASRFKFLLLAIDQIGIQVYFPQDRDILLPYHFNYLLSLATGIFDGLAIETKSKYDISFDGDHRPSRISLSIKSGRDFLRQVKLKNSILHNHIKDYEKFIELIHTLRQLSIHREGFRDMAYEDYTGISLFFEIKKQKHVQDLIKSCGEEPSEYDKFTSWGVFDREFFIFLEPYRFATAVANKLVKFSDRYLELMGFTKFLDSLSQGDYYRLEQESFSDLRLGF